MARTRFVGLLVLLPLLAACDTFSRTWESVDGALGYDSETNEKKLKGERIAVLTEQRELTPDEALAETPVVAEMLAPNAAWPQLNATVAGVAGNLAFANHVADSRTTSLGEGADFDDTLVPPPVIADGRVYGMDGEGNVSAHDAATLSRVWVSAALVPQDSDPIPGGGVAYGRGRLVAVNSTGKIIAFNAATGDVAWTYNLNLPVRTSPRIAGSTVLMQTADNQLYALNLGTGEIAWRHRGVGELASQMAQVAPAAAANIVVVAYGSGDVVGVGLETGEELWQASLAGVGARAATAAFSGFSGSPVIADSIAYAGSTNNMFAAIDTRDGQRLWEQSLTIRGTPYVADGWVFVVSVRDVLYAIDRTSGAVRWAQQLPAFADAEAKRQPYGWQGPVMAGGKLWLISTRGVLLAVDAQDPTRSAQFDAPSNVRHTPVFAQEKLWLEDASATLHQLY